MRRFITRRPSPAMGVAFVALVAALSGTAVALPGVNTVDSGDIKNGQVKGKDIRKNAVTGVKIKNGAVGSADVKNNGLTGADINEGALGQVPSSANANTATSAGTAGVANSLATGDVNANTVLNPAGTVTTVEASCDAGLKGISAGLRVADPNSQFIIDLYPVDLDTWGARVQNDGVTAANATLFVICGAVNSVTLP
jgi:hypothetical protein